MYTRYVQQYSIVFFRRDGVGILSLVDSRRIVDTRGFAGCYESYCRFLCYVIYQYAIWLTLGGSIFIIQLVIAILVLPSDNVTYMFQPVIK